MIIHKHEVYFRINNGIEKTCIYYDWELMNQKKALISIMNDYNIKSEKDIFISKIKHIGSKKSLC